MHWSTASISNCGRYSLAQPRWRWLGDPQLGVDSPSVAWQVADRRLPKGVVPFWALRGTSGALKVRSILNSNKFQIVRRKGLPFRIEQADILTIHLVLSSRTRGLIGATELKRMKPMARLINTSRGPIVDEQALITGLQNKRLAGAAIDVFVEPLPPSHPFRTLDNLPATPYIGYVSQGLYKTFYEDTVSNIRKWLDAQHHKRILTKSKT